MAKSLLLGLFTTAIIFPPLAQAVAIKNKTNVSFFPTEAQSHLDVFCTSASDTNQCRTKILENNLHVERSSPLWLENAMGILLSGSMFAQCPDRFQPRADRRIQNSWQASNKSHNLSCIFPWQNYATKKAIDSQNSMRSGRTPTRIEPKKSTATTKNFPKLSRSSLIVSLPQFDSGFVPQKTQFANPAPETKRIASPFGWRRRPYSYQLQFHQGIDYGAPFGSPVVAIGNGIVTKVVSGCYDFGNLFCGGQLGNWIEIDHGNGKRGVYGHLKNNSITVKEGMKVWKNQEIARVGSSGWSTGAHLDFRFKVHGEYQDPAKYVMEID